MIWLGHTRAKFMTKNKIHPQKVATRENTSQIFKDIANQISIEISNLPKSYAHIMPKVKIQNTTKTNTNLNKNKKSDIKTNI